MNFKVYDAPHSDNTVMQILLNRGLSVEEAFRYMNLSEESVNNPLLLGEDKLAAAKQIIDNTMISQQKMLVIVDSDCDGFTSSALFINYLYEMNPTYVEECVEYRFHEGKQHGLTDMVDYILKKDFKLVVVPDGGSNDYEPQKTLKENGIEVIVLDHHETGYLNNDAVVINNQMCDYPNKSFSGVGIVWQFCRYMDTENGTNYADKFIDLVALGNIGDMMDLRNPETRYVISKGLRPDNIQNPFIYGMWQKNMFKLTDEPTAWGYTFYIVPMVNACNRSGSLEDKQVMFQAMLTNRADVKVPSTKRGHKAGEMETICTQSLRVATNVKRHQDKAVDESMAKLIKKIEDENLLQHKVLLLLLPAGYMSPNTAGLVANKLMAKYQRPCCVLMKNGDSFSGSARGCDIIGVTKFKDICEATNACEYTIGHQGAFGLSIKVHCEDDEFGEVDGDNLYQFIEKTDEVLKDISSEPIYFVDYLWDVNEVEPNRILDIAKLGYLWGSNMQESKVGIKNIEVSKDNITVMASNTLKITLPNGVAIIKFRASDEEIATLTPADGTVIKINIVGTCNCNEWAGEVTPQIFLDEYEIQRKAWVL